MMVEFLIERDERRAKGMRECYDLDLGWRFCAGTIMTMGLKEGIGSV